MASVRTKQKPNFHAPNKIQVARSHNRPLPTLINFDCEWCRNHYIFIMVHVARLKTKNTITVPIMGQIKRGRGAKRGIVRTKKTRGSLSDH